MVNEKSSAVGVNIQEKATVIWNIANALFGYFKPHEYGLVILPMTVVKRFHDCLLPTHDAVIEQYEKVKKLAVIDGFLTRASGYQFYNTSRFTFESLLADPDNIEANFRDYLAGFSGNVQDVLAKFDFDNIIRRMVECNSLYLVIKEFNSPKGYLGPDKISAVDCGYIFEDLVKRFSESFGEEAGAHFTSRDIIYLMTDLLLCDAKLDDGNVTVYDMTMGTSQMLSCMEERIHELNSDVEVTCFGQEFNPSTFAIAKADMMIRGGDPNNMRFGDTLSDDQFPGFTFRYCISNPPFGIDWKKTHEAAKKYLAQMGLESIDPHTPLSSISIAMQQLVAIARAMVINAKVLILDEPTSSLDANEVRDLFAIMRKVRDSGVAILFVSHFLDQIYEITDRLTILRNGQFIKEVMTKDTPRDELIGMMIGKSAAELSQIGAKKARREITPGEKPIVDVKGLGKKGTINPVDVDIYKGEVVGFAGLLGSGRTELGRLLYGADKPDSGTYTLNGKKVNISDPYTALKNKIAYSTENRRDEGIIGDLTVRQNILIALQATRGMFKPIPKKEADAIVDKYMKELNVRPADPDRPVKNLSGGNQQKVLIGRWLATHPELLILDEPTRGIDIGAKAEIQQVVLDLASQGMGVVFISSELEEVVRLSDDIEVLKDRHKIAEIENDDTVSQATIVETIANTNVNTGKEA